MSQHAPLIVAGIIFSIVAFFHLVRLIKKVQVTFGRWQMPMSASVIGFIVAAAMAVWMFISASK